MTAIHTGYLGGTWCQLSTKHSEAFIAGPIKSSPNSQTMRLTEKLLDALADVTPWQLAKGLILAGLVLGCLGALVIGGFLLGFMVLHAEVTFEGIRDAAAIASLFLVFIVTSFAILGSLFGGLLYFFTRRLPEPRWAGFKCEIARDICLQMTPEEKQHFRRTSAGVGILFGLIGPAAVVAYRAEIPLPMPLLVIVPAAVLAIGIIWARRYLKKLLCATEYARRQNITPDDLRI